jgi:hypothetical protein
VSAAGGLAAELLPGLQLIYARTGLPAWTALAMALHESGAPPAADSTLVVERNPWGVRPHAGESYPAENDFIVYPSLLDAAQDLIPALGPQRLALASDPAAFLQNLQATGWDGPPPGSDGYASSVLDTWGPVATAALQEIGADPTSGATPGGAAATGAPSRTFWLLAAASALVVAGAVEGGILEIRAARRGRRHL